MSEIKAFSRDWVPVGEQKHVLFFDTDELMELHNVRLSLCQANKHPNNPVLPLGDLNQWDSLRAVPWEARTVFYDEEERLFKAWYGGSDASPKKWWKMGYAVSSDGITWEKPELGLFAYNGNKRNNICAEYFGPVLKDYSEPDPEKRYKMFVKGPPGGGGRRAIDYSSDGIHWGNFVFLDEDSSKQLRGDAVFFIRDEQEPDASRRYKMVWQNKIRPVKPGPYEVRAKFLAYGPTENEWRASPVNPILSPNDGMEAENHFLMIIPYRGWYVMLYEYGWYVPNGYGVYGHYCSDVRLAVSRDGEHFRRVCPEQRILPRGGHGEWDDQFLVISDKVIVLGDTLYIYYSGQGEAWTSWPSKANTPKDMPYPRAGCIRVSRMGLATLKLDRFTCLETRDGETPGYVVTEPMDGRMLRKGLLRLNVSRTLPRRDWLDVEVLGATSNDPLSGFSRKECRPVQTEGIDVPVVWDGSAGSAEVDAGKIRLRFHIYGRARLHAYSC